MIMIMTMKNWKSVCSVLMNNSVYKTTFKNNNKNNKIIIIIIIYWQ